MCRYFGLVLVIYFMRRKNGGVVEERIFKEVKLELWWRRLVLCVFCWVLLGDG